MSGYLSDLRALAKVFLPPILVIGFRRVSSKSWRGGLFDGDDHLFKSILEKTQVFGEYGCGESTVWAVQKLQCVVHSVDSSQIWVERVKQRSGNPQRLDIRAVDLGPVGDWGYPVSYSERSKFLDYIYSLWGRTERPDTVLIDGRFRVACFFATLSCADVGTKVIFDDYVDRTRYRVVEELLKPADFCGRQALFEITSNIDRDLARKLAEDFKYVLD